MLFILLVWLLGEVELALHITGKKRNVQMAFRWVKRGVGNGGDKVKSDLKSEAAVQLAPVMLNC